MDYAFDPAVVLLFLIFTARAVYSFLLGIKIYYLTHRPIQEASEYRA